MNGDVRRAMARGAALAQQPPTSLSPPYRMSPIEVAHGWLFGSSSQRFPAGVAGDPWVALEAAIRPALLRLPCVVLFSGGRDSSAVLAAAMRLARREGLPEPVAMTQIYPGDANADESYWQERVIRHVGVSEWERVIVHDQQDWIGPVAGPSLREHGQVFPPGVFGKLDLYARLRGGSVITGEHGDDVFGVHRAAALQGLRRRGLLRPARWVLAARHLAPRSLRYRRALTEAHARPYPWLRTEADELRARLHATDVAQAPLDWREAVWRTINRRAIHIGMRTMDWVAAQADVQLFHPLGDERFVARFAAARGRTGFPSRASAMMSMFGDVLPEPVLRRTSKAYFNASRFGPCSRAFAESWDGRGVDPDLVDAEALRNVWLSDLPHAGTASLLQQAWLAGQPDLATPVQP